MLTLFAKKPDHLAKLAFVQLALMVVIVAAFVVDTLLGIHARSVTVAQDVESIVGNAMPSVQHLAHARELARQELEAARRAVKGAPGRGPIPTGGVYYIAREDDEKLA
jgi:hypothetical protein